jgi:hypothetical protein
MGWGSDTALKREFERFAAEASVTPGLGDRHDCGLRPEQAV